MEVSPRTVFILLLLLCGIKLSRQSLISLHENGYRNIIVALPADAVVEDRARIVTSVKELFELSSRVLYVASKRRAAFSSITLLIPKSWGDRELWLLDINATVSESNGGREFFSGSDVLVSGDLQSTKPYTLHAEGCGKRAVKIYLPTEFLLSGQELEHKCKEFIHHWAQYRYGVFPEGGFEFDSRYPIYYSIPGTDDVKVTSCTNTKLSYSITYSDAEPLGGDECSPEVNKETGKIEGRECLYIPLIRNETLQSSLMYQQALPHTLSFCDADLSLDKSHNPSSPSKHNALCFEEGAWFVILRDPDFARGNNQATKYKPEPLDFVYVQESNIRVVVATETSVHMHHKARYRQVKNALAKFITSDLPFGSELGLVFFTDKSRTPVDGFVTLTSEQSRIEFLESAPIDDEAGLSNDSCPECALRTSMQLLQNNDNQSGLVILITTKSFLNDSVDVLIDELRLSRIRLVVLLFSDEEENRNDSNLERVAISTAGSVIHVPERETTTATTLAHLYAAFAYTVVGLYSGDEEDHILLMEEINPSESETLLDFVVDQSASRDLKLFVSGPTFQIQNPPLDADHTSLYTGSEGISLLKKQPFLPAWLFHVSLPEVGNYTFKTKGREPYSEVVLISVIGKAFRNASAITARTWINIENHQIEGYLPVKIFAEVRYGVHPIIKASVTASVYHPDDGIVSSFSLVDDGLGDPDITKNDGIYSRYFSNYTSVGYYSIVVRVNDNSNRSNILYVDPVNCCGSSMPTKKTGFTGPFSRVTGPLSFHLISPASSEDVFPPNRILDLQVIGLDLDQMKYDLQWTSAGDDFDNGIASTYELKLFSERTELRRRFEETGLTMALNKEITHHTPSTQYGGLQQFTVQLPRTLDSGHYYFAVRAVDEANNKGEVSNTIEIIVKNILKNNTIDCELADDHDSRSPNSALSYNSNIHFIIVYLITAIVFTKCIQ